MTDPTLAAAQSAAQAAWNGANWTMWGVFATAFAGAASTVVAAVATYVAVLEGGRSRKSRRASRKVLLNQAIAHAGHPYRFMQERKPAERVRAMFPGFRISLDGAKVCGEAAVVGDLSDADLIELGADLLEIVEGIRHAIDLVDRGRDITTREFLSNYGGWTENLATIQKRLSALRV